MIRFLRTHQIGLLLALITLVAAVFLPHATPFLLPFAFGTLLSNDDKVKYLVSLGLLDANGLFLSFFRDRCETLTANRTLTILDSGKTFFIGAADLVVTLPAAATATLGMRVKFLMQTAGLSAGTGFSISPAAADYITVTAKTETDNKDLINTGATDDLGDVAELVCDGVDGWIATIAGTWAKES